MGRPIKRQFFDFNVPSTTEGHLRTLVKKNFFKERDKKKKRKKKKKKNKHWKERKNQQQQKPTKNSLKEPCKVLKRTESQKWKSWVKHSLKK